MNNIKRRRCLPKIHALVQTASDGRSWFILRTLFCIPFTILRNFQSQVWRPISSMRYESFFLGIDPTKKGGEDWQSFYSYNSILLLLDSVRAYASLVKSNTKPFWSLPSLSISHETFVIILNNSAAAHVRRLSVREPKEIRESFHFTHLCRTEPIPLSLCLIVDSRSSTTPGLHHTLPFLPSLPKWTVLV